MKKEIKDKKEKAAEDQEHAPDKKTDAREKTVELKESEYEKILQDTAEYKDKFVRLYAELENMRKRYERDKLEFVKYANEELMTEFLTILDDLERALEAARSKHQDYEAFLKGVQMVMAHLYEMLKKNNVLAMESVGKTFDPHCHEVLMQEETEAYKDGEIVEEFQKGYYLGDKVIRTAKVKVAVRKEDSSQSPDS